MHLCVYHDVCSLAIMILDERRNAHTHTICSLSLSLSLDLSTTTTIQPTYKQDIKTWADPDVKIRYTTHGTEGHVGTTAVEKDGWYWFRTQEVVMPLDDDGDDAATIFTNHAQYHTDWMHDTLEPMLDGSAVGGGTPSDIRAASNNARERPFCPARQAIDDFDRVRTHILSIY